MLFICSPVVFLFFSFLLIGMLCFTVFETLGHMRRFTYDYIHYCLVLFQNTFYILDFGFAWKVRGVVRTWSFCTVTLPLFRSKLGKWKENGSEIRFRERVCLWTIYYSAFTTGFGFYPWNSLKTLFFVSSFKAFASPKYLLFIYTTTIFALYLILF